jgi:hypothetical protein
VHVFSEQGLWWHSSSWFLDALWVFLFLRHISSFNEFPNDTGNSLLIPKIIKVYIRQENNICLSMYYILFVLFLFVSSLDDQSNFSCLNLLCFAESLP